MMVVAPAEAAARVVEQAAAVPVVARVARVETAAVK